MLRDQEVLLIHKKTGHGQGKINAPGGKLEAGESVAECAVRETREEVGLQVKDLVCRAELRFVEQQGAQWLGYAFTTRNFYRPALLKLLKQNRSGALRLTFLTRECGMTTGFGYRRFWLRSNAAKSVVGC